jgi:hypothetical protein
LAVAGRATRGRRPPALTSRGAIPQHANLDLGATFTPDGTAVLVTVHDAHQTWIVDPTTGGHGRLLDPSVSDISGIQRLAP